MPGEIKLRTARAPPGMQTLRRGPASRRPVRGAVSAAMFLTNIHRTSWMTEEAASADRRRSLLQDNPTSG